LEFLERPFTMMVLSKTLLVLRTLKTKALLLKTSVVFS
jgi:hypothetical protein